ncbi:hypothetical protein BHU72_00295 [Desulfuribacillus stibiiarsenatis]|uniref:AMP-dependent synthetase/ligase domain-containing protein n=1 Tax=Desulfuribacillus stibiiarsenatis TaxID=1390249 RepID=A0A1E5L9E5_9FIRM|nr:AMP-binding protein [Desulfuribacillus stibiiarsenatis]OEH86751.1 hypothetical protein BHU72_00295 [Desulfuribacillus stibiiarsenatis]
MIPSTSSFFWDLPKSSEIAIIDSGLGNQYTYEYLYNKTAKSQEVLLRINRREHYENKKLLGCILTGNKLNDIIFYLAALQINDAIMLIDSKTTSELLTTILAQYCPDWISGQDLNDDIKAHLVERGYCYHLESNLWINDSHLNSYPPIYGELAVLLSTSGSTGNPKMVRLSRRNLQENANSIANYLMLSSAERAITSLPMSYSYGLSVINSHLYANACLILTNESIISPKFWSLFREANATSLAGVPYSYQMLHRLRFHTMELPSLRMLTQAGGRLSEELISCFHQLSLDNGWKFFVMYGQTEATARISFVPPERLSDKIGSIGVAIPNGHLELDEHTNELIYSGPNVMLGYAQNRYDLAKEDELKGVLHTGDIAYRDDEGYFYITGRMKRFVKLYGLRLNLDDIEKQMYSEFNIPVACTGDDEKLSIWLEENTSAKTIKEWVSKRFQIHHSAIQLQVVEGIPYSLNGKVDYKLLTEKMNEVI